MVNYISHKQPMFINFSGRYLAKAEESKSEKRFALSSSGMGENASTLGSSAELSPRSEGEGAQTFGSMLDHYADDEVDHLRAKLNAKARAIEAEGDKIQAVSAQAEGVMRICQEVDEMIDNWSKTQQDDLQRIHRTIWGLDDKNVKRGRALVRKAEKYLEYTRSTSGSSKASSRRH